MKFGNLVAGYKQLLSLFILTLNVVPSATMAASDVMMKVSTNLVTPSCSLDAPAVHILGNLKRNDVPTYYPAFTLKVNCPSSVKTTVLASIIKGEGTPGKLDSVNMENINTNTADGKVKLLLYFSGRNNAWTPIDFANSISSDSPKCFGTSSRACEVKPALLVKSDANDGVYNAIIRFTIHYY